MSKRRFRFSVEFAEDVLAYSKEPEFNDLRAQRGQPLIRITVDHEDGYVHTVPIDVKYDPSDATYTAEWEVSELEEMFEREVFRPYRN